MTKSEVPHPHVASYIYVGESTAWIPHEEVKIVTEGQSCSLFYMPKVMLPPAPLLPINLSICSYCLFLYDTEALHNRK